MSLHELERLFTFPPRTRFHPRPRQNTGHTRTSELTAVPGQESVPRKEPCVRMVHFQVCETSVRLEHRLTSSEEQEKQVGPTRMIRTKGTGIKEERYSRREEDTR